MLDTMKLLEQVIKDTILLYKEQLDISLLNDYLNNLGRDMLQRMLKLYIEQSAAYLDDINKAVLADSQSLWQERCHKMKGAAASAGLIAVHSRLIILEKKMSPNSIKTTDLGELKLINDNAIETFKHWLLN